MTDLLLQAHSLLEAFHLPKTGSKPALNKYKNEEYTYECNSCHRNHFY